MSSSPSLVDAAIATGFIQRNAKIREVIGRRLEQLSQMIYKEVSEPMHKVVEAIHIANLTEGEGNMKDIKKAVEYLAAHDLAKRLKIQHICIAILVLIAQYESNAIEVLKHG